jgi:hypothetical protein
MTLEERFWSKVSQTGESDCWEWEGTRNPKGYGRLAVGRTSVPAHRYAYELLIGPFPPGLVSDHLCRNRGCVNPSHIEPVTNRENILRGRTLPAENIKRTHCKRGHPFDEANTYITSKGARDCRACKREAVRRCRYTP